jgi:hypothetical protein
MSSISNAQQAMGWRALAAQPRDVLAASVADGAVEIERLKLERDRLAEFVAKHTNKYFGGDWACQECHPSSDLLINGFQCAYHLALKVKQTITLEATK